MEQNEITQNQSSNNTYLLYPYDVLADVNLSGDVSI